MNNSLEYNIKEANRLLDRIEETLKYIVDTIKSGKSV